VLQGIVMQFAMHSSLAEIPRALQARAVVVHHFPLPQPQKTFL
jgi:hypothetical protein